VVRRVGPLRTVVASRWFKLALSAALLTLLLLKTDLREMRNALAAARLGWLGLALAVLIGSQIVSAYRWALLAWAVGFAEPFGRICIYYLGGMYLNLFGPGTIAGDLGRTLFLAGGCRRALALTTVVAHRAIGLVALVWIGATAVVLLPDQPLPGPARWLAALAVPATIAGWLWGPRLVARLLPRTNNWRVLVERDLAPYWHDHRLLALSLGWAALAQLTQLGAQVLITQALGLHLPWSFFLVVVPVVGALGALPFSLQGVGVREAGYWYYLAQIGVPRETALSIGLLTSAVVLASGLSGLPAFLMLRRRPAPQSEEASAPSP
jgi:glycosyltransferase 2 family protein